MEVREQTQPAFEFSGGALCLDFANTIGDRPRCQKEKLGGIAGLLRWCAEAGIIDNDRRERLSREAAQRPRLAGAFYRRAIEFRERVYRVFAGLAVGKQPGAEDLAELNRSVAGAMRHLRVEPCEDGFRWGWETPDKGLDWMLWPVARSAGELLTSEEVDRVRECNADCCSWLFIDRSRTRRRRWCDMSSCGNREKAKRHYERKRRSATNDE